MVQISHQSLLSLRIRVWHPNTRRLVRLLGPCFKTGRLKPFRQHPKRWCGEPTGRHPLLRNQQAVCTKPSADDQVPKSAAVLSPARSMTGSYNTDTEATATFSPLSTPGQTDVDLSVQKCTAQGAIDFTRDNTGFKRFPFDNFTYCLTLFSKFFSSFPHGTCSLSVSRQYLALDGIYHPFWSAFPNKPTLGKRIT
jgi:hypothetical protein